MSSFAESAPMKTQEQGQRRNRRNRHRGPKQASAEVNTRPIHREEVVSENMQVESIAGKPRHNKNKRPVQTNATSQLRKIRNPDRESPDASGNIDQSRGSPSKKVRAEKDIHNAGMASSTLSVKAEVVKEVTATASAAPENVPKDGVLANYMTNELFSNLKICDESRRALSEVLKFTYMTHVQATCIDPIQQGTDCLAKSKTGTGKTLAFLIPSVETIRSQGKAHISILVLAPTRELATQIAVEARKLLTFHAGAKVVVFVGGTNITGDRRAISGNTVTVLVATPGRLIDHIDTTPGFCESLAHIKVLVLDEADRLLDMGFKPSIDKILRNLPPKDSRQTLLFSATIPPSVIEIARNALRPGYVTIDTTGLAKDDSGSTHLHVHQELVVARFEDFITTVAAVLYEQISLCPDGYKMLVFFTTARVTGLMAELFTAAGFNIVEMHSRKSQSYRTKASEKFRTGRNILMFSSDVTARGMDYPGVTFVLQVGLTDKEQYIHRLGRTARAGKEGKGMLVLSDFEERHMRRELKDLPLHSVPLSRLDSFFEQSRSSFPSYIERYLKDSEHIKTAQQAYIAWLGFFNSNLRRVGFDKVMVVQMANRFATEILLLPTQPSILKKTVGKMGLKGVPGLKLE